MPLNSTSKPLYPIDQLNELAASAPPAYSAVKIENNSEINLQTKISSLIKPGKTAYIAVDSNENNNSYKRKLMCILENQKTQTVTVKEYNNEEFKSDFAMLSTGEIASKDKKNQKKVRAILYVKSNELHDDKKKKEKTLVSIDKIITNFINDRKIIIYEDYPQMRKAYDTESGNSIESILENLDVLLSKMKEKIKELNRKNFDTSELGALVDEMELEKQVFEKAYSDSEFYSFSPLVKSFLSKESDFGKKIQQLEKVERIKVLENNIIKLQTNCKNVIPSETTCTEGIFLERNKIKDKIDFLLASICDSKSDMSNFAVAGLENKYTSLQKELVEFSEKINLPKIINNSEEEKLQYEQERRKNLFAEEIQPRLDDIENYSKKTSLDKTSILNKIVQDLNELKQKIKDKANINEIREIITKIKDYIKTKLEDLRVPRGFFSKQGKSADLIQDLASNLDNLVSQDVEEVQVYSLSNRP